MLLFTLVTFLSAACNSDPLEDINIRSTKEPISQQAPTAKKYMSFALGEISFFEAGLSEVQWGWINKYDKKDDTMSWSLLIRDEHYVDGDGLNVGEVLFYYLNGKFVAEFHARKGFAMMETNLYASHEKPGSWDPATFSMHHKLTRSTVDRFSVYVMQFPIYVIAHATIVRTQ
ncbi:hypothetical protein SDC9_91818 [bioreactor metagenome]|uniref:Uncharacterized protein n=1 Tax=bioreactor metagenome TaxID=1076179 RepID=A0A645A2Q8_9ZZZZ